MKHTFSLFIFLINIVLIGKVYSQSGWIQVNPGFNHSYNSVHFVDSMNGLACGAAGAIIKTSNGGINWINISSGINLNLNDIKFFTPSTAIAVGDYQIILQSTNGGLNWSIVNAQASQNYQINNINLSGQDQAIAHSITYLDPYYYRYLYKTSNMGSSWQILQVYVPAVWMHFLNLNTGWANGSYFTGPPLNQYYLRVSKTTNGGINWTVINQSSGVSINPGKIYFYDNNLGFKFSHIGTVYFYRSLDGGVNWGSGGVTLNRLIRCYYFVNSLTGWIVGENSLLYKTDNGGSSWTEQISPVATNLNSVNFINSQTGWIAAGAFGLLLTHSGGVYTSIKNLSNQVPEKFYLSQNYPNPFNPLTKIKFEIPLLRGVSEGRGVLVRLIIYDILGREIATLINQQLKPGTYEVEWDGINFPSGVYFYKLMSDEFSDTKKMVLIK